MSKLPMSPDTPDTPDNSPNPFAGVEINGTRGGTKGKSKKINGTKQKPKRKPAKPRRRVNSGRPRGRPVAEDRVIVPSDWGDIGALWIKGWNPCRIAEIYGVCDKTISHHLKRSIIPWVKEAAQTDKGFDLAELNQIRLEAWTNFESSAPREVIQQVRETLDKEGDLHKLRQVRKKLTTRESEWLEIVLKCVSERARILGHYAPTGINVRLEQELRLAGSVVTEVGNAMVDRMIERIEEQRKYVEQVKEVEGDSTVDALTVERRDDE